MTIVILAALVAVAASNVFLWKKIKKHEAEMAKQTKQIGTLTLIVRVMSAGQKEKKPVNQASFF